MTESELSQYKLIKLEIEDLDYRIKQMEKQKEKIITDKVTGSSADFPYTLQHFNITGVDQEEHDAKVRLIEELQRKRRKKYDELIQEETRIHDYIYSIPKSEIRQIVIMSYVDGLTQAEIGRKLHMDQCTVSKKLTAYFQT